MHCYYAVASLHEAQPLGDQLKCSSLDFCFIQCLYVLVTATQGRMSLVYRPDTQRYIAPKGEGQHQRYNCCPVCGKDEALVAMNSHQLLMLIFTPATCPVTHTG